MEEGINNKTISCGNENNTKDLHDKADGTCCSKSHGVLDNEEEAVPSSWAE